MKSSQKNKISDFKPGDLVVFAPRARHERGQNSTLDFWKMPDDDPKNRIFIVVDHRANLYHYNKVDCLTVYDCNYEKIDWAHYEYFVPYAKL